MSSPTLKEMSGERDVAPVLKLNEIRVNGQTGQFMYKDILSGRNEETDKFAEKEIGPEANVVFLKIRRRLVQYRKDKKPLISQEHNSRYDTITLWGNEDGVVVGSNDDIRARFDGLKTQQIVYALYIPKEGEKELVRLIVKGSSLGSYAKNEETPSFYDYVSSFKEDGKDEHFYEYVTRLFSVKEDGQLGPYFAASFEKKEKITDEGLKDVEEAMKKAYTYCIDLDEFYGKKKSKEQLEKEGEKEHDDIDTIEYPTDDIDLDDIPF